MAHETRLTPPLPNGNNETFPIASLPAAAAGSTSSGPVGGGKITVIPGDLFAAPAGSVLIHACNCVGSWNSGVALAFKQKYPTAYTLYHTYCLSASPAPPTASPKTKRSPSALLGTTLLIPPQRPDFTDQQGQQGQQVRSPHWIACLFTSTSYGARVDPPYSILKNTRLALLDLVRQIRVLQQSSTLPEGVPTPTRTWHSAMINSKRFKVPWEETEMIMLEVVQAEAREDLEMGKMGGREVVVYKFEEGEVGKSYFRLGADKTRTAGDKG